MVMAMTCHDDDVEERNAYIAAYDDISSQGDDDGECSGFSENVNVTFLFLWVVMRQNGPNDCHDDTKTIL